MDVLSGFIHVGKLSKQVLNFQGNFTVILLLG